MKMTFKDFLTEGDTRRNVMAKLRKKFHIGAENTYSEKQKGSRMVKVYNVNTKGPRPPASHASRADWDKDKSKPEIKTLISDITKYIKDEKIPGLTVRAMTTGMKDDKPVPTSGYRRGVQSIAFQFDNEVYGK